MFTFLLATLAGSSGMAAAASPARSSTALLQVKGTLLPSACRVELTGNGTVDYGHIPRKNVPDAEALKLNVRYVQLTVRCEDPMIIKMTARDEKSGTAVLGLVPGEDNYAFGLGSVDETKVGQYRIEAAPGTFYGQDADGHMAAVDILHAYGERPDWSRAEHPYFWANGDTRQSYATPGKLTPGVYRMVTGSLRIDTRINRRDQLPSGSTPLAGLATVEIVY